MKKEEIKSLVIDLISELLSEKDLDNDIIQYIDLIDDVGMDSITFISLVVQIEDSFKITVPDDVLLMENFKNVDSIVNVVEKEILRSQGIHE